jgi:hypothetical protein
MKEHHRTLGTSILPNTLNTRVQIGILHDSPRVERVAAEDLGIHCPRCSPG